MKFISRRRMIWLLAAVVSGAAIAAWSGLLISGVQQRAVIEGLRKDLRESYVDATAAREMDRKLAERSQATSPGRISFGPSFADDLEDDLAALVRDGHLRVLYTLWPASIPDEEKPSPEEIDGHFGFKRVDVLPGNIGYIQLDSFSQSDFAAGTLADTMTRMAPTRALILDLRENNGGYPDMGLLMTSYFFDHPVHWNDEHTRDEVEELWTDEEVAGRRYLDKPVYILTSRETVSEAEEFSYHMKNLKRATIVGEPTAGAANGVEERVLATHFLLELPVTRPVSPVTGTNWESVGVQPDILAASEHAMEKTMELIQTTTMDTGSEIKKLRPSRNNHQPRKAHHEGTAQPSRN